MTPLVAKLFTTAAIVVISGTMLAQSGDRLADLTDIGRVWTGSFLVGLATSLPELSTDFAAVHYGLPCHGLVDRDLFLQNVPVLDDSVVLEAEDIDRNQRFPDTA